MVSPPRQRPAAGTGFAFWPRFHHNDALAPNCAGFPSIVHFRLQGHENAPGSRFRRKLGRSGSKWQHSDGCASEGALCRRSISSPSDHGRRDVNVFGYVGNTDRHRSNRNDISVTVNGRWIQDSDLSYAIEQGYGNSLPMGRRPIAVIHLVVPAEMVDVNAHPTKQEVRFRHESKIFAAIQRAVREALSVHGAIHQAASRPFGPAGQRSHGRPVSDNARFDQEPEIRQPADEQDQRARPMPDRGKPSPSTGRPESQRRRPRPPEDPLVTTDLQAGHNLRDTIPELRLIGQAQRTFILADGPDGLYVLDQHAAHERFMLDRVLGQLISSPEQAAVTRVCPHDLPAAPPSLRRAYKSIELLKHPRPHLHGLAFTHSRCSSRGLCRPPNFALP